MNVLRPVAASLGLWTCLCAAVGAEAPGGDRPGFAVTGFTVADVGADETTLSFDAELSNPTSRGVSLAGVSFVLAIGGKRVLEGTAAGGEEVPPGRSLAVSFPGRVRYADLPGLAAKTVLGGRVPFRLLATAEVRTPAGTLALPFVYDGDLSTPRPPDVGLAGLRVISWNPLDAAVEVSVALENANAFPLPAGLLRYRVSIAGGDLSEAEAPLPAVAPRAKTVVAIPIKVSVKRVGARVMKALRGEAAVVGLHAMASVGALAWPVDLEARLPMGR
jgi:hypothetical protein